MRRPPKKTAPKRAYHHGDLRRALLDAAVHAIEEEGPRAVTIRDVARRVGVSQAAPYHHFQDKDAMLAAVAEEGFSKLHDAMIESGAAAGAHVTGRLRGAGEAYVRFATRHPAHFRAMFSGMIDFPDHPTLHAVADRTFDALVKLIEQGQAAGDVREGDPCELGVMAWSMVHGLSMLYLEGNLQGPHELRDIDALAEAATETLARGLSR